MTTRRGPLWVATVLIGLSLCAPTPVAAQVPVHEILTIPPTIRKMIVSAARYYTTAKLWANEARRRTDQLVRRAEGLTRERQALESRYMGNLGSFGGSLPRYDELRGRCATDSTLAQVCQGESFVAGRGFEQIIASTYVRWRDTVMVSVDRARDQSLDVLVGYGLEAPNAANDILYGSKGLVRKFRQEEQRNHQAASAMGQSYSATMALVQMSVLSVSADSINEWVGRMQDSVATDTTKLSEARALQLQLRASLADTWLLLEAARGEVLGLEASARNLQRQLAAGRLARGVGRTPGSAP